MRPPTTRQAFVLSMIRDYVAHHQRPPTVMDLALILHVRPNAVARHLTALVQKGLLAKDRGKHRAMRPTESA